MSPVYAGPCVPAFPLRLSAAYGAGYWAGAVGVHSQFSASADDPPTPRCFRNFRNGDIVVIRVERGGSHECNCC